MWTGYYSSRGVRQQTSHPAPNEQQSFRVAQREIAALNLRFRADTREHLRPPARVSIKDCEVRLTLAMVCRLIRVFMFPSELGFAKLFPARSILGKREISDSCGRCRAVFRAADRRGWANLSIRLSHWAWYSGYRRAGRNEAGVLFGLGAREYRHCIYMCRCEGQGFRTLLVWSGVIGHNKSGLRTRRALVENRVPKYRTMVPRGTGGGWGWGRGLIWEGWERSSGIFVLTPKR